MSLVDFSALSLNAIEPSEESKAVFEKTFLKPELAQLYAIHTGITMKTQIPFFGKLAPFLLADQGDCSSNEVSQNVSSSEKFWDPELLSGRLSHCQGDMTDSLFKQWRTAKKQNPDAWAEVSNELLAFLEDRITDAISEDILLKSFFGDVDADNVTDGGNITDGVNAALFTSVNGFWKQVLAGVTAGDIIRYTIPENALATKALQADLATDRALQVFRYLYDNIDSRALEAGEVQFQVSRSIATNWRNYLMDKSLAFTLTETEKGSTTLMYQDVPIIVRNDWDRNIRTYFDQGATYLNPHRAILTSKNNMAIGTLSEDDFKEFRMFYVEKDKKFYIDSALSLDAKLLEEYMVGTAY